MITGRYFSLILRTTQHWCKLSIYYFIFLSFFPQDRIPNLQGFGDGKCLEVFNFRLFENKAG
jgi:hypothetical protein